MKDWKKGDAIIFTYPNDGNTYRFTLDLIRGDGYLQFLSEPERGAMGNAISGGLTLSPDQAQTVWEANQAAVRTLNDQLFHDSLNGAMALIFTKGLPTMSDSNQCIYFVGSEMTGKTTLVGFVEEAFGVPRLRGESARIVKDEFGGWGAIRSRGKTSDAYQLAVFNEQLDMELRKPPAYVADRCLLDSLAYASEYASIVTKLWFELSRPGVSPILQRLERSIVFLVKPHKELSASDGERLVVSYENQLRIDAKIELMLQQHGIRPIRINDLESNRREEQISLYLEAKGFKRK